MHPKKLYDGKGRKQRDKSISKGANVQHTARDTLYYQALATHGELPTSYLYEFTKAAGKDYNSHQHRLQKLRDEAKMIECHEDQFNVKNPYDKELVYRLSDKGRQWCADNGIPVLARSGWWRHQYMTSCITASFHLAAGPAFEMHPAQKFSVHYAGETRHFTPDALFTLTHNGKRRWYALEADRSTEQKADADFKKTVEGSFNTYRHWVGPGQYKNDLKTQDGIVVLFVSVFQSQMHNALAMLEGMTEGKRNNYIAFNFAPYFGKYLEKPPIMTRLYTEPWSRVGAEPFFLNK